jgi:hypothetical protein
MMRDLKWSPGEKVVARNAFDQALQLELKEIMAETKEDGREDRRGIRPVGPGTRWLTQRRLAIDCKYDFRYSVLPFVLATLLKEGRVGEDDLHGLSAEKFEVIRRVASPRHE